jgi:ATP/maltotriose-dependent transcriptional regulator MalT
VGRTRELAALEALVEAPDHSTAAVLICGEGGVGKSRLADELAGRAERRGWSVARGRAYPVETGVPYALFSDAFLPLLRELDHDTLTVLSRGGEAELRYLFPALAPDGGTASSDQLTDPEEFRTRLLWNFAEFLKSYAGRTPLLVILEDLQWADDSSLQLLHFLARQAVGQPIVIIGTYSENERERIPHIAQIERSLSSLRAGEVRQLEPLTREQVAELISRTFAVDPTLVSAFSALLFGWTRGNPFFVEEVLKSLVNSGRLHQLKGTWIGWDAKDFELPGSIRDAVLARVAGFSPDAQVVAELAAVIGTRATYPLLAAISVLEGTALLTALEELCAHGTLSERADGDTVVYDFPHPLVRQTLYAEFGLQRVRLLHGAVAEAMEAHWGDAAMEHADELAYHFARTDSSQLGGKAARYLAAAGRAALARHADREAVNYLRGAVGRWTDSEGVPPRGEILAELARAHTRLGEYQAAIDLWTEVLNGIPEGGRGRGSALRALGLVTFWEGRPYEAMAHLDQGLAAAQAAGNRPAVVQLRLIRGHCLQEMGRGGDAKKEVEAALPTAEELGDPRLLARVHRSLALLHVWIGPPEEAGRHAELAIELATDTGDLAVEFWARWGLAVLSGMRGDIPRMAEGVKAAEDLADRLRSPVLRLWTAEMSIEMAYASGDWERGIALGEQSIELARNLNQRTLLPRLLVWTSVIYVGRGHLDRAQALVDEAAEVAGLDHEEGPLDVHLVVPAYIGRAHHLLGTGDYQDAIAAAEKGLLIAEGTGYILWAVHRLLPALAEACLWAGEIDKAEDVGRRLREHSQDMDHKLGLAWAEACDALVCWKRGDAERGAVLMRQAAEGLESIPMVPEAARIRRQLAGRLAEIGDLEGCLQELRSVHETFSQLGADLELEKTRMQFREIDQRPPPRRTGDGVAGLTGRELQIARLVAARMSNKAIGKELGISPRTASTHLSNIFQKLDVSSRGQLADLIRDKGLLED